MENYEDSMGWLQIVKTIWMQSPEFSTFKDSIEVKIFTSHIQYDHFMQTTTKKLEE